MRYQALVYACRLCAEQCARSEILADRDQFHGECPHACRSTKAACEMVESLAEVEGILFIQALRLCVGLCNWCAGLCESQPDPEYQASAGPCQSCAAQCQLVLEQQISAMIHQD